MVPGSWLNYHHLYYFYVIAREGGIAKAAKVLRLGQPTLSTQLKQFEANLGHPLFERVNRGMRLTETGRVVFEYAKDIFTLGHEMLEVVNDRLPARRVHLQVGALDSVPKGFIHDLVQSAYRAGDCYVSVLEGEGDRLLRELRAHRVDLVITNSPAPIAPRSHFHSRKIGESKVIICGAPKFAKLRGGFPKSLDGQPMVLPTAHSKLRSDIDHYFSTQGIDVSRIGETQDTALQKMLALSGNALVPIALAAVQDEIKRGDLIRIGEPEFITEQVWLTSATRKVENPVAAKLMATFKIS